MNKKKSLSMSENIYGILKEKIVYGEYQPGELLNEGDLANQLNVSKTPVREALNGLRHEGLVEIIPYKGYLVRTLSFKEIKDLFEARIILESEAANLAAKRASSNQINILRDLASQDLKENESSPEKVFSQINRNFHLYVGEISGNNQLALLIKNTINQLQPFLFSDLIEKDTSITRMMEEHLALVEAIEQREGERAKEIMEKQLQESQLRIINLF